MMLPADVELRAPAAGDECAIAELVGACDESYRSWTPPGWEPPPPGRELDRWRGRITDGSWWTRIAVEPSDGEARGEASAGEAIAGGEAPGRDRKAPGRASEAARCQPVARPPAETGRPPAEAGKPAGRGRGRVVGLVCFTQALTWVQEDSRVGDPIPQRAHVSAVFTHPDRWREGIAAAMLAGAEDAMRAEGYREVQLWTPRDAPARRFYETSGWGHDGREQWLAELALPIVAYVKAL